MEKKDAKLMFRQIWAPILEYLEAYAGIAIWLWEGMEGVLGTKKHWGRIGIVTIYPVLIVASFIFLLAFGIFAWSILTIIGGVMFCFYVAFLLFILLFIIV